MQPPVQPTDPTFAKCVKQCGAIDVAAPPGMSIIAGTFGCYPKHAMPASFTWVDVERQYFVRSDAQRSAKGEHELLLPFIGLADIYAHREGGAHLFAAFWGWQWISLAEVEILVRVSECQRISILLSAEAKEFAFQVSVVRLQAGASHLMAMLYSGPTRTA